MCSSPTGAPAVAHDDARQEPPPSEIAVAVRHVGKCYEVYRRPLDRLKQTLWRGRQQFYREFWALRGVSFELRRGEALGVIGRNGSGKSTLLQIIAETLRPSEGQVQVHGRVHALLELGSGFNHEFTGRENVFLNGAVLGLSHAEIAKRFDEIAAFADIGDFVQQPVKTYSTGMVVRLAFAVQVLLEPDILLVDEALAVGDAAFQVKCMSHMKRLIERGVAVILVTHDVSSVRTFCDRALWLEQGRIRADGPPLDVTSRYMRFLFGGREEPAPVATPAAVQEEMVGAGPAGAKGTRPLTALEGRTDLVRWGSGEIVIAGVALDNGQIGCAPVFELGERLHLEVQIRAVGDVDSPNIGIGFSFRNTKGLDIITYTTWDAGERLPALRAGQGLRLGYDFDNILAPGDYALVVHVEDVRAPRERHYYDFVENSSIVRVTAPRLVFSTVLHPIENTVFELQTPAQGSPNAIVSG